MKTDQHPAPGSGQRAEIISVGTELLLGHTVNTDAAWLARSLSALGIDLLHCSVVGDNPERLEAALVQALARSELVITTGGLGPTDDDLTKAVVARVVGRPLVEYPDCLASLREYFGERPMTENQLRQAWLPEGATVFANPNGTAPGCAVPAGSGRFVILLPGPPRELVPMLEASLTPFLAPMAGGSIASFMVRTFGIGEGAAATILADLLGGSNPTAATYAADGEMFVRVTAKATSRQAAEDLARPLLDSVCKRLGDHVYGINVDNLEQVVVQTLIERGQTLATAESCTGGLLARKITDVPGASEVFGTGLVTYANSAKMALLQVDPDILATRGAVSVEVARQMAENVRRLGQSDYGIGITGIAGPGGGSADKPVGLVHIGLATSQGTIIHTMRPRGRYLGREWTRNRAAGTALDLLRRLLEGKPVPTDS